jgi:DNA-binding transcriptional MerR regulator
MDEHEGGTGHGVEMGLTDLAEAAGVSVRTIRYYISEGLLPPSTGAGPRAAYTAEHLDRLRLIARLKDAYLPLREIRRRLRGLDAAAVRALLMEDAAGAPHPTTAPDRPSPRAAGHGDDSAAAYLARLLPPRRGMRVTPFAQEPAQPTSVGEPTEPPEYTFERSEPEDPTDPAGLASLTRADLDRGATLAAFALADPDAAPVESLLRLRLGHDAELLIRADAYDRQREQIDALIAWARHILG